MTFAKEVIAVLADRGIRNSLIYRMVLAVRSWVRQHMPSLRWSEADIRELLSQADSFLCAGRNALQRASMVQLHAFAQPGLQYDEQGRPYTERGNGRFQQRGARWYLADKGGELRDFATAEAARAAAALASAEILQDPEEGADRT